MARQSALWVPERAEVIWIGHSPHSGREMKGEHPMLVCSPSSFNTKTGIVIGLPMTHAEFNADNPFALPVKGPKNEVGYVLAFQPKSFDWKERGARPHPWGAGHTKVLEAALKKLDAICAICER
jgi:mRNA interferase MazF